MWAEKQNDNCDPQPGAMKTSRLFCKPIQAIQGFFGDTPQKKNEQISAERLALNTLKAEIPNNNTVKASSEKPKGVIIASRTQAKTKETVIKILTQETPKKQNTQNPTIDTTEKIGKAPDMTKFVKANIPVVRRNYEKLNERIKWAIDTLCKHLDIDKSIVLAVMANESKCDPTAESGALAQWLMQVMPGTASLLRQAMKNKNPQSQEQEYFRALSLDKTFLSIYRQGGDYENLALGIAYLRYLKGAHPADYLRRYNGGHDYPDNRESLQYTSKVQAYYTAIRNGELDLESTKKMNG